MRNWTLLLVIAFIACPAFSIDRVAATQISVEKLEKILLDNKSKPDSEIAKQISSIELTERLTSARFEQFRQMLPGEKSREALLALADNSAFLDPPANDIPGTASPDAAAQRRMMAQTVSYLGKTLPLLPNLFAERDTLRFESRPSQGFTESAAENPLRAVSKSRVTVLYRDGREFVDAGATKDKKPQQPDKGLTTWGEFGPILATVFIDAAHSHLAWSHWELSAGVPQAVFTYSVPKEKSHYDVRFCCVTEEYGIEIKTVSQRAGYHGVITVDPDSGTILRLTLIADLPPDNPIGRSSIAVEYGPVEIGGKTYFCPIRGIAIADAPDLKSLSAVLNPATKVSPASNLPSLQKASLSSISQGSQQTLLNDISFRDFHLFRVESKIVTGNEESEAAATPAPPVAASPSADVHPADEAPVPPAETAVDSSSLAVAPPAPAAVAPVLAPVLPAEPLIPEMSVTAATGLPDSPAIAPNINSNSPEILRINARLVDLSLVALDKKGRPVTNLRPEDLEVYDEGHKVDMRSFAPAASAGAQPAAAAPATQQDAAAVPHAFTNHTLANAKAVGNGVQDNTIILLIDSNLSFDDLSNTREQMEGFLTRLHDNERVAILIMRAAGFEILQDTTTDHGLIAAKLAKWTPSAQNIARGQEQEARNRQQMEDVHSVQDLLSVNGHEVTDTQNQTQALDPKLRELGDNPGQDALSNLVLIARHLGAIPGHKSLVWIASDNVLADWTNASINVDKGSRVIQPSALRAQEAMNEAHVSIYPLDASRLEAGGIDASISNRNVALNPAMMSPAGCGSPTPSATGAQLSGPSPELSGADINTCPKDLNPGRLVAQMHQDLHPIQGVYRELADATGGRTFRRSSDIISELNGVAADGRATYLLSFTPAMAADDKYHFITIKLVGRKDVTLRYRTGFNYRQEPTTIKDRFRDAAMKPEDATEIAMTADLLPGTNGRTVKLGIAATDLALAQKDAFWTDKIDVYLVQREASGNKAHITGQTLGLHLKPGTYQQYLREGIPFNEALEIAPGIGSVRIIVLDENSGRIGSVTIPATAVGKAM